MSQKTVVAPTRTESVLLVVPFLVLFALVIAGIVMQAQEVSVPAAGKVVVLLALVGAVLTFVVTVFRIGRRSGAGFWRSLGGALALAARLIV